MDIRGDPRFCVRGSSVKAKLSVEFIKVKFMELLRVILNLKCLLRYRHYQSIERENWKARL